MGEIEDRVKTYDDIQNILSNNGYIIKSAASNKIGEGRIEIVDKLGNYYYAKLQPTAPHLFSEFLNDYREIHAFSFGIIHSCTRLLPLKVSEIDGYDDLSEENKEDIKKENHYYKGSFWGLRILIALVAFYISGSPTVVLHMFGW
ncbi:MAG: hypothetical protein M0P69_17755 [Bacteroidales bacterium]|nr:hypothetical protein [Bacteroidales bacterium]